MIIQAEEQKIHTPKEYLEFEINSEERHEFINGEIVLMTGGTPNHNQIALNLSGALNFALKRQPYRVFVTAQRLWIPRKRIYTYPDVMIVQGELQLQEGRQDTITNPLIIAEVLSKSTRSHDKAAKFDAYRTIPSFQEYLLIDQYTMHIEYYFKTEGKRWTFYEYDDANEIVNLNSFLFQITLEEIYEKVEFESAKDS